MFNNLASCEKPLAQIQGRKNAWQTYAICNNINLLFHFQILRVALRLNLLLCCAASASVFS